LRHILNSDGGTKLAFGRRVKLLLHYGRPGVLGLLALALPFTSRSADVVSIWGGARGTVVRKSDGTVWTWGANFSGKLGVGLDSTNLVRQLVPTEVHGPGDAGFFNSIMAIMGGEVHNVALKSDGTVWTWGNNMFGQLGNGSTNAAYTPVQVSGLSSVTALGGRGYHTLAVDRGGSIWGWGWNSAGELGNGTNNATTVPVRVVGLTSPAMVSAGYKFSIAMMPDGTVYQWGHGRVIGNSYTPVQTPGLSNIITISAGWDHALALRSDHTVWAWGLNGNGELGDGSTSNRVTPVQITTLSNMVAVSGGDWHSSALDTNGMVWKWGRNDVGQLGNGAADGAGNYVPHPLPARIQLDNLGGGFSNIVMVAARDWHNIALKSDGSVWQWGANDQGQCGDNTTVDRWRPVQVAGLGPRVGLALNIRPSTQPGYVDIRWASASGEFFNVEYTTDLAAGFSSILLTNIQGTPPSNVITVPATNGTMFYRLRF
jgi:alpha-tubulin suppressor-like RCC1 family protein